MTDGFSEIAAYYDDLYADSERYRREAIEIAALVNAY